MENSDIKVSVCVVVYNQKDYIAECIESIIAQEVTFNYEVIIGDDCSTDGTRDVILSYANKYPELIRPIFRKENIGVVKNLAELYMSSNGEYIAHMDGDDVMMPYKLATQVAILDANPDCYICSHEMIKIDNNSSNIGSTNSSINGKLTLTDLYRDLPFFAHSSKLFRNNHRDYSTYASLDKNTADFELHIYHAKQGNIFHIKELLGKYRVGVGIGIGSKRINPILPERKLNVLSSILLDENSQINKYEARRIFAKYMQTYAKGSLLFGQVEDFKKYMHTSKNLALISFQQFFLIALSSLPSGIIIFFLRLFQKKYRN